MSQENRYYAGIGSRDTPDNIQVLIGMVAKRMARKKWILRSGGARGADMAFEEACDKAGGKKEIFRPEDSNKESLELASTIHPIWRACNIWAKRAHARNCQIILGKELDIPVKFVVCWTPRGKKTGGTRTGIILAESRKIPVYNLGDQDSIGLVLSNITKHINKGE